jgi:hypothetical protein
MPAPARAHHYVPAALIGEFSSMPTAPRRESKVTCLLKGDGMRTLRGIRASEIMLVNEFYSLPSYPDPVSNALLVISWRHLLELDVEPPPEDSTLREMVDHYVARIGPDGLAPDAVERVLAEDLDGPACVLLEQLRSGHDPSTPDLVLLWRFIALGVARSPVWYHTFGKLYIRRAVRDARRDLKQNAYLGQPEVYDDALVRRHSEVLTDAMYPLFLANIAAQPEKIIGERLPAFTLLTSPAGVGFVMTDYAGRPYPSAVSPTALPKGMRPLDSTGMTMTVPIGPHHALRATYAATPTFVREAASEATVRGINTALLTLAQRFVVLPETMSDVFLPGVDPAASVPWRDDRE